MRAIRTWNPSYFLVAQLSHFGWGALFVMTFQALDYTPWWGVVLLLMWALPKEFVFDIWIEKATWQDSAIDFALYVAGALIALFLIFSPVLVWNGQCMCNH